MFGYETLFDAFVFHFLFVYKRRLCAKFLLVVIFVTQIFKGWETDQEADRRIKLTQLRRRGAGPPKKGETARGKKK